MWCLNCRRMLLQFLEILKTLESHEASWSNPCPSQVYDMAKYLDPSDKSVWRRLKKSGWSAEAVAWSLISRISRLPLRGR